MKEIHLPVFFQGNINEESQASGTNIANCNKGLDGSLIETKAPLPT